MPVEIIFVRIIESKKTIKLLQGKVAFSSQGDRIAKTQVEQLVNGSYQILGYHNTENNTFDGNWTDAYWIGKF